MKPKNYLLGESFKQSVNKKPAQFPGRVCFRGGERGIRTPGPLTVNGFQDRRIRPLCHLSNAAQK